MKKKRALLISCAVILICMSMVVGGTYSLLTSELDYTAHLKAGDLAVKLERTNLKYTYLSDEGYLAEVENSDVKDFTKPSSDNIFGLKGEEKMVPGSFYQATLQLTNQGDVAFTYSVEIDLTSTVNDFAEQLKVTVTDSKGNVILSGPLASFASAASKQIGYMTTTGTDTFTVLVEFISNDSNNDAVNQTVDFDLCVKAVQAVSAPSQSN